MTRPFSEAQWQQIGDEAVDDLRALLRMPTVNPPGDEGPAADWVEEKLRADGLEPLRLDDGDRPNVVARLRGDGTGGGPLLLAGHLDVVPVEPEHWSVPPFDGVIRDGYLYGRGAIDMKNMVVMSMYVLKLARRAGLVPTRDIVFAAVADEEEGCTHGSRFLVEQHPEHVRAEYMIGEVGGFSQDIGEHRYYPIQVAEKGMCRIRITARGEPGHGSIPHGNNALTRLALALLLLGETRLPVHRTETVDTTLTILGETQGGPIRHVLSLLPRRGFTGLVLDRLLPDRALANVFGAWLSNTVTATMLDAGIKANAIPSAASAILDGRLVPGQTAEDLLREIHALVGPDYELEVLASFEGREDPVDDPLYRAICDNVRRHDPGSIPMPVLTPGFTDAQFFGRLGARCYGYSPVRFPREDGVVFSRLFHGHDERIHVDGFRWGLRALWDLVHRFAFAPAGR